MSECVERCRTPRLAHLLASQLAHVLLPLVHQGVRRPYTRATAILTMASYTRQGVRRYTRRATGHATPGPARRLDAGAAILTMATLTVAYLLWLNSPWRLDAGLRSAILLGTVLTHLPTYSGYLLAGEAAAVNQGAARSTCEVALRCSWFKFSLGTRYTRQVYNYLKPLVHCTRDTASAGQEHCKHNFKKKPVGSPESQSKMSEGVWAAREQELLGR